MKIAYIDSSVVVGLLFEKASSSKAQEILASADRLISGTLLEAEVRSAIRRERVEADLTQVFGGISWVFPERRLTVELERVLSIAYLRGADVWHLALALYVDPAASELTFLSLDQRQAAVAAELGFSTL